MAGTRAGAPVYLERCDPDSPHPIYGVRLVGAGPLGAPVPWRAAYDPIWACGGHDLAVAVRPGEAWVDTLRLSGPNVWHGVTHQPDGVLERRFQLSYQVRSCPDPDRCPFRTDPTCAQTCSRCGSGAEPSPARTGVAAEQAG